MELAGAFDWVFIARSDPLSTAWEIPLTYKIKGLRPFSLSSHCSMDMYITCTITCSSPPTFLPLSSIFTSRYSPQHLYCTNVLCAPFKGNIIFQVLNIQIQVEKYKSCPDNGAHVKWMVAAIFSWNYRAPWIWRQTFDLCFSTQRAVMFLEASAPLDRMDLSPGLWLQSCPAWERNKGKGILCFCCFLSLYSVDSCDLSYPCPWQLLPSSPHH